VGLRGNAGQTGYAASKAGILGLTKAAAKELAAQGVTAMELCAGFGNEGIARVQRAVGPDVAVGAVKFDFHPGLGFKSGDALFG